MFGVPSLLAPKNDQQSNQGGTTQGADYDTDEDNDEDNDGTIKPRLSARVHDPDAMDWEPDMPTTNRNSISPTTQKRKSQNSESIYLRPPRFTPEQPTGLENLLMRTRLVDSDDDGGKRPSGASGGHGSHLRRAGAEWNWCWVYTISTIPVVGLILTLWASYGYPLAYLR
jgi:hypothetical protein